MITEVTAFVKKIVVHKFGYVSIKEVKCHKHQGDKVSSTIAMRAFSAAAVDIYPLKPTTEGVLAQELQGSPGRGEIHVPCTSFPDLVRSCIISPDLADCS